MTLQGKTDPARSRRVHDRRRRPSARVASVAPALVVAAALGGCQLSDETGFVEVKRQFAPPPSGVFRLNGEDIAGLAATGTTATTVVRQKTGSTRIDFVRDGQVYALCRFELRKNRIVTATLYLDGREIKCGVAG